MKKDVQFCSMMEPVRFVVEKSLGYSGHEDLMREIHALAADGELLKGMAAFREVYNFTPYGKIFSLTGVWPLRPMFDLAYRIFARNRIAISKFVGRFLANPSSCEGNCHLD